MAIKLLRNQVTSRIGDAEIVLETFGFEMRRPAGGIVWNRPAAVRFRGTNGEKRLPIHDITRRWQLALYVTGLLFVVAGLNSRGRSPQE